MNTQTWYKSHEGWVGALVLSIGAFALGVLTTVIIESKVNVLAIVSAQNTINSAQDQTLVENRKAIEDLRRRVRTLEGLHSNDGKH